MPVSTQPANDDAVKITQTNCGRAEELASNPSRHTVDEIQQSERIKVNKVERSVLRDAFP
jgi:hypothetical protein